MKPTRGRVIVILTSAIALLVMTATMVVASHQFSDVPTSSIYHSAIDWGFNRGIITGCGGGKFCPNSNLTRGQAMAVMNNLANVVSPHTLQAEVFEVVNQDLDGSPVVCQTDPWKRGYATAAFGLGRTSLAPDINNLKFAARVVYQRNGGAWTPMPPEVITASQATVTDEDIENVNFGELSLDAGATYTFGIRIELIGHTPTPGVKDSNYECALMVQIFNR
jgi:hypothetical protein